MKSSWPAANLNCGCINSAVESHGRDFRFIDTSSRPLWVNHITKSTHPTQSGCPAGPTHPPHPPHPTPPTPPPPPPPPLPPTPPPHSHPPTPHPPTPPPPHPIPTTMKMAVVSQTIFSDFFWMKSSVLWLKFVPKGPIDYHRALVKIMAWCRIGDKPLSELMLTRFTAAYVWH